MSLRRILLIAVVVASAALAADLAFQSTLLRALWPVVLTPPDGAIVTPPITLRWEGPPHLSVVLITNGLRQDLGQHDSPFEIASDRFPRPGQYSVEVRSALLGAWSQTQRRFLVQLPEAAPEPTPCADRTGEIETLQGAVARLESERNEALEQIAALRQTTDQLQTENAALAARVDELHQLQDQLDAAQETAEGQREDAARQRQELSEENRLLRAQLESVPPCTTWGYLTYPRPQTIPTTRRLVVVSDSQGLIFRSQLQCEITRRVDRGAASPCVCVGQTWTR
jgi:regulator of replication initiation timing